MIGTSDTWNFVPEDKLVDGNSEWVYDFMACRAYFSCALYHYYVQDLTSQVSAETDPVSLLPKVISLLYLQVS